MPHTNRTVEARQLTKWHSRTILLQAVCLQVMSRLVTSVVMTIRSALETILPTPLQAMVHIFILTLQHHHQPKSALRFLISLLTSQQNPVLSLSPRLKSTLLTIWLVSTTRRESVWILPSKKETKYTSRCQILSSMDRQSLRIAHKAQTAIANRNSASWHSRTWMMARI